MSIGTSVVLSPNTATEVDTGTITYALRAADLARGEYSVAGQTLPNEQVLTISHETTKDGTNRHLVRIDQTINVTAAAATASVYAVIVRPPSADITDAVIIALVNQLIDFFIEGGANGRVSQVLNKEV